MWYTILKWIREENITHVIYKTHYKSYGRWTKTADKNNKNWCYAGESNNASKYMIIPSIPDLLFHITYWYLFFRLFPWHLLCFSDILSLWQLLVISNRLFCGTYILSDFFGVVTFNFYGLWVIIIYLLALLLSPA